MTMGHPEIRPNAMIRLNPSTRLVTKPLNGPPPAEDDCACAGVINNDIDILASHSRTHQRVHGTVLRSQFVITVAQYVVCILLATKYFEVRIIRAPFRR